MARIVVGGFQAEINSFHPRRTLYQDFIDIAGRPYEQRATELLEGIWHTHWGISGFCAEARGQGHEIIPTTWAMAQPAAEVTDAAFESICGELLAGITAASRQRPIDAVFLCLHGAMVSESHEDADGEILRRVRATVGDIPVVATLDLHANITRQMVDLATLLVVYRTYPHIDMAESGRRAARALDQMFHTQRLPAKAFRKLPFLIPTVWQCTTIEPAKTIYSRLAADEASPVVSLSFAEGFPASDIHDCGPAVIAYGDSQQSAEDAVAALTAFIEEREADFAGTIFTPQAAIAEALRRYDGKPVVLADTQDNPGGGGISNTVGILRALVEQGVESAAVAVFYDPAAANAAHAAGCGSELDLALGSVDEPLRGLFTVEALSAGNVVCKGPMLRDQTLRLGTTALLRIGAVRIVVASARIQPYDQEIFRHLGLDPSAQRLLVLKSTVHFRNDFEAIASCVLIVDSPGVNITDPRSFNYRKLRQDVRLLPLGQTLRELRPW
jgi:microcystin degradation protein MlrC